MSSLRTLDWRDQRLNSQGRSNAPSTLFLRDSLTAKLRSYGGVKVHKIQQHWGLPKRDERLLLYRTDSKQHALIREVILTVDDIPWVFARSVLPHATLSGPSRFLRRWGTRPLGEFLFSHRDCYRSRFQFCQLSAEHPLMPSELRASGSIWGRRSLFFLHQKPLIVAEYYLPAFLSALSEH